MEQHLVGTDAVAIDYLPMHGDAWVQLAKDRIHPGGTGDHCCVTGNDSGRGQPFGRDQLRSDVAAADVFQQCTAHVGFDFGGEVGKTEIRHNRLHRQSAPIIGAVCVRTQAHHSFTVQRQSLLAQPATFAR